MISSDIVTKFRNVFVPITKFRNDSRSNFDIKSQQSILLVNFIIIQITKKCNEMSLACYRLQNYVITYTFIYFERLLDIVCKLLHFKYKIINNF